MSYIGFQFRWVRRLMRRYTKRITAEQAGSMKLKLAFIYLFFAANAGGFALYNIFTGNADWPKTAGLKSEKEASKSSAVYYAELLNVPNAQIIRFRGFHKIDDFYLQDRVTEEDSRVAEGDSRVAEDSK